MGYFVFKIECYFDCFDIVVKIRKYVFSLMENVSDIILFLFCGDSFIFLICREVYLVFCSFCSWIFVVSESSEKEVIGIFFNSENDVMVGNCLDFF